MRYPAFIENGGRDYGVVFPDIDGIGAMGYTLEETLLNAQEVLRDYAIEMEKDDLPLAAPSAMKDVEVPEGCALTSISLIREAPDPPSARLNYVLDAGVAKTMTREARRRDMSRRSYLEWMTKTLSRMEV